MNLFELLVSSYLAFGQVIPGRQQEIVKYGGVQVIHADGAVTLRLKEVGRDEVPGSGSRHVRIRLKDEHYPFEVTRHVRSWADCDAIETWAEIRHAESGFVKLLKMDSFAAEVPVKADSVKVLSLTGLWSAEANLVESPVGNGQIVQLCSKSGTRDAWESNAGMMVSFGEGVDEASGRVLGVALEWTGATERSVRRGYESRADVIDFVTVGGIYDDNRTIRTMHGAYTKTLPGRVIRHAGNPVFPNGTIAVRFRDVPGAKVEVALDPSGAQEYALHESVADGVRTGTVGKKGRDYPALLAIALVRADDAVERGPVDVSFARGRWNPDDFEYAKSWRWPHFNRFEQADEGLVNLLAPDLTPEQVYRTCHDSSYVAMLHRRRFPIGSAVSSTMSWDYRMAPIIVLAPDVGTSADGVPEFRDHWEVCLYDKGINVWYHYFEGGRQKWHKAADCVAPNDRPFKADTKHELVVKTEAYKGHRRLVVTCGDVTFAYVDDNLPETFRAGIIGCEGRNWFYDFKVGQ